MSGAGAGAGAGAGGGGGAAAAGGPRQSSLHESSLSASLMFVKNDVRAFNITPANTYAPLIYVASDSTRQRTCFHGQWIL